MTGNLDEALLALLRAALPSLLGGGAPTVQPGIEPAAFELEASATDVEAGQPRSDEAGDTLPFDAATAAGPYTLSRPPDTSIRKVRLTTAAGDRIALQDSEVLWDKADLRRFTLALRPARNVTGITGVLVLYGVTAVYATVKYTQELALTLSSPDTAALERAQALSLAVLALHRGGLVSQGAKTESANDYAANISIKALHLLGGDAPSATQRRIHMRAEIELKGVRALAEGEGAPIVRLRSPGAEGTKPVDLIVQVGA
jgi:hypothetical protein